MTRARQMCLVGGAALAIGAARWWARAPAADDWDAIGFALAVEKFDLARFQPHFPGYPVYVALMRAAHLALRAPLDAAVAVSAAASATTAAALWRALGRLANARAAWLALALWGGASLPWLTGAAAWSDATATALAALAFLALVEERALAGGALVALMLGARASYFPLALSWLLALALWRRRGIRRALVGGALGTAAWAAPFVAVVGARRLLALGATHVAGHFTDWGGSVVTRPDPLLRLGCFARDLCFDGLAPRWWATAALALLVAAAGRLGPPSRRAAAVALVVALPYALWALLAQNVIEQPRHALPLVLLLVAAMALALARAPLLGAAAVAVVFAASLPTALAHRREAPAGAQLAAWLGERDRPAELAVFGGRSIRSVQTLAPRLQAREALTLAEVDVTLERFDVLPRRAFVTDEVAPDPARAGRLRAGPRFCRDAVLDRRQPCLQLYEYALPGRAP